MGQYPIIERKERLDFIRNLITHSFSDQRIAEEFAEHYNLCLRQAWRYVRVVRQRFLKEVKEKTLENILDEYNQLIDKYELRDPKLAKDYRQQRDKILGIIQTKVDITSGGEKLTEIKIIEVKKDGNTGT